MLFCEYEVRLKQYKNKFPVRIRESGYNNLYGSYFTDESYGKHVIGDYFSVEDNRIVIIVMVSSVARQNCSTPALDELRLKYEGCRDEFEEKTEQHRNELANYIKNVKTDLVLIMLGIGGITMIACGFIVCVLMGKI